MRYARRGSAVVAVAAAGTGSAVAGCGDNDNFGHAASVSPVADHVASAAATSAVGGQPNKLAPRSLADSSGPNYTIADYIRDEHIDEIPVHNGDANVPSVSLPMPAGRQYAGSENFAADAFTYTGPEAQNSNHTPDIVVLMSKLRGQVDPPQIIDKAGGEMKNLAGFSQIGQGAVSQVFGYSAYLISGTYDMRVIPAASAQETIVIPAAGGLCDAAERDRKSGPNRCIAGRDQDDRRSDKDYPMIRIVTTVVAAAAVVALAGCSASIGTKSVDKKDVASEISDKLSQQVGRKPDKVECPDNLPAKVGATLVCTLTDGTDRYDVHVNVTGVDGDNAQFDIKVDDAPKS